MDKDSHHRVTIDQLVIFFDCSSNNKFRWYRSARQHCKTLDRSIYEEAYADAEANVKHKILAGGDVEDLRKYFFQSLVNAAKAIIRQRARERRGFSHRSRTETESNGDQPTACRPFNRPVEETPCIDCGFQQVDDADEAQAVRQVIARLNAEERRIYELLFIDGLTVREASTKLQSTMSKSSVHRVAQRVRAKLTRALDHAERSPQ